MPTSSTLHLHVEYPERFSRGSTLLRVLPLIPAVILGGFAGIAVWLLTIPAFAAIVVARRYPRGLFDLVVGLSRFLHRVNCYSTLVTDKFPLSDNPAVQFNVSLPESSDLSRLTPFVKWFLAIPHHFVLGLLRVLLGPAVMIAWVAIVITGEYPRPIFAFVVGLQHWHLRVTAYSRLFVTDEYPPFAFGELSADPSDQG